MGMYSGSGTVSGLVVDANLNMGAYDLVSDDIAESTGAAGVTIDGMRIKDSEVTTPGSIANAALKEKVASDNNRHAHSLDIHLSPDCSVYAKIGGFVFADGLKGTVRVECDVSSSNGTARANIKYMVSGVQKGIEQDSDGLVHATYKTNTQDIALDIPAGGVLELWLHNDNDVHHAYAKNWKIDYDNAADAVANAEAEE